MSSQSSSRDLLIPDSENNETGINSPILSFSNYITGLNTTKPLQNKLIPVLNSPYVDSVYGTQITRVTSAEQITDAVKPNWVRHEYSRRSAFNSDSSLVIMNSSNGWFRLYSVDKKANTMSFVKTLPIAEPQEPNWHPTKANVILTLPSYGEGMTISEYNLQTNSTQLVRNLSDRVKAVFPQANQLWTKQEGRPSDDASIWCFIAMTYDSKTQTNKPYGLVSYHFNEDKILGTLPIDQMPDHISTSPSGKFCVPSWAYSPALGTRAYATDFKSFTQLHNQSEHSDLAKNSLGKDIYVFSDYDSGDVAMVELETGLRTNLFRLYGANSSGVAMHFSGLGTRQRPGYVLISFYACTINYGKQSCDDDQWFKDKVVLVELKKDPKIYNLAHTHYGDAGYFSETQAVSNNDFSQVLFVSTWHSQKEEDISSYLMRLKFE